MSSAYELEAQQYQRFSTQRGSQSPTRQAAVKFLMTSPENPFGAYQGDEDNEDGNQLNVYQRRHTIAGQNNMRSSNAIAASPESGVKKVSMYSQLQEEIKKDMRRRTDIALAGDNQFQFLIGCRSDSPSKNYDFAENAISSQSMINIGANSPDRNARMIKKISPYDCFRSSEARQTIVQCKHEVEREMESHQRSAQQEASSPLLRASQRNSMQPIAPYRKYKPAAEPRMEHAVPYSEPDADADVPQTPPRRNMKRLDTATFGGPVSKSAVKPHRLPQQMSFGVANDHTDRVQQSSDIQPRPTTLGQQMLDKYTAKNHVSQIIQPFQSHLHTIQWPSTNAAANDHPSRQSNHTTMAMFRTLNTQNPDDQKQLLDFYSQKYKLKDLSKVQPQTYSRSQINPVMKMDELRMVNPEVVKRFNLGTVDQLIEINQLQNNGGIAVGQPLLGQQMTRQQLEYANRIHNAALVVQRHIRGQLVRKKAYQNMKAYLFFRRVHRIVNIRSLIFSMKNAFINVRNTKQRYLKKYIYFSAAKIQSLVRGHLARKIKIPIQKKIKNKKAIIEAVALGWQTRRIMKLKEVQNRVQQIHDYENAEVETLEEAKKSQISGEEKQKLMNLIDGFRQSRSTTVVKLVKLLHDLSKKGLWLTYVTTELPDEGLRTPRKSAPESFLKRGTRTATGLKDSRQNDPFLKVSPSPARNLNQQSGQMDALRNSYGGVRSSFGIQSVQERRLTTQPAQTSRGRNVQSSMAQRKFTISHNNIVQPNFQAQSYQEEARNAFKKRMQYNPMEASKKRLNVNPNNLQSEYSQHRKADNTMDVNDVMKQVQERIAENMRQHRARSHTSLNKSADFNTLPAQQSHHQPVSHLFQKHKQNNNHLNLQPEPAPSESSRPDTPPFDGDGRDSRNKRHSPTHVKISELTSSIKAEEKKNYRMDTEQSFSKQNSGTLAIRNTSTSPTHSSNIPAAGKPSMASNPRPKQSPERPSYLNQQSQPLASALPANISTTQIKPYQQQQERPSYQSNALATRQPTPPERESNLSAPPVKRTPQPPAFLSNANSAAGLPKNNQSAQKTQQNPERPSYLSNASSAARVPTNDLDEVSKPKASATPERTSYLSNATPQVAAAGLPSTQMKQRVTPQPPAYLSNMTSVKDPQKINNLSDTKSSLFGSISQPSTIATSTTPQFEKSSKDFKQTPAKFSRQKSDSPNQGANSPHNDSSKQQENQQIRNKDLDIGEYPKFQFSSKPQSPPATASFSMPKKEVPSIPAQEIKNFMKPQTPVAATSQTGTASSITAKKAPSQKEQAASQQQAKSGGSVTPPSQRHQSNKASESANELLAMMQNRSSKSTTKDTGKKSKVKKSAEPKSSETKKKKRPSTGAPTASASGQQKPSIFASAVATRNNAKSKDNSAANPVYNSTSSVATAHFGRISASHQQESVTATNFATNQSVSSSQVAGAGSASAHKGIKPYQASRRKREERKRAPTTDELDIDKSISMFSSTAKQSKATNDVQPQPYTAMTSSSISSTTKRRTSTTSGLFRKSGK